MNLAVLYSRMHRNDESEQRYKEAMAIRERLAEVDLKEFAADLALVQKNLALLYLDTARFKESEPLLEAALQTYKGLAEQQPETYQEKYEACRDMLEAARKGVWP